MKKDKRIPKEVWQELERMQSEFNGKTYHKIIIRAISIPITVNMGIDIDGKNKAHLFEVGVDRNDPLIKSEMRRFQRGINQYLKKCQEVSEKYKVKFDPWWLHL